jgi:hypothetical protein
MASILENKRLLALCGVAVVAAGAVAYTFMSKGSGAETAQGHSPVFKRPAALAVAQAGVSPSDVAPGVPGDTGNENVFERKRYVYRSVGRIDPFQNLVSAAINNNGSVGDALDPSVLRLVGILEKNGERRALVEDGRGYGYVLRKGDRVLRGKVTRVGPDFITFRHSMYGVTEAKTLKLDGLRKGEVRDGIR